MQIVHLQSVTGYITSYPKPERTAMVSFLCVCANEFPPAVMWRRKCMKEVGLNNCPFIESKIKMTCKDVYNSETDYFHFQDLFTKHFLSREVKSGSSSIPIFFDDYKYCHSMSNKRIYRKQRRQKAFFMLRSSSHVKLH